MKEKKEYEFAEVEADLTFELEATLKEVFNVEIEMMQGSREIIGDEMVRVKFNVKGNKADMIMKFMIRAIGRTDKVCKN